MQVIIGVDPHKGSHTAVAISAGEEELDHKKVRACRTQVDQLLSWAEPFPTRTWAIEGAEGMGYLLAQQLVATGEHVLNVPATLAARTRLLGSGRTSKSDPNDALSVAVTALRSTGMKQVRPVGHSEVLRLLAKRNKDIGNQRTRLVCRMHALLIELDPGGMAKETARKTLLTQRGFVYGQGERCPVQQRTAVDRGQQCGSVCPMVRHARWFAWPRSTLWITSGDRAGEARRSNAWGRSHRSRARPSCITAWP